MSVDPDRGQPGRSKGLYAVLDIAGTLATGSGLLCLALFAFAQADGRVASAAAITAFEEARRLALATVPDQSLWSPARRSSYEAATAADLGTPNSLLRIPSIDLLAPVLGTTSELALNRGVGWIETTASPGSDGNVGLAGHRDGFFRRLQELAVGDSLELQTIEKSLHYRVTKISIVEPTDVHVLEQTGEASITLVTCYPFYYVGNAPQRFIVRAVLDEGSTSYVDSKVAEG